MRFLQAHFKGVNDIQMITLCHAINDIEVMYIRAMLQSAEIPFHIVGENFGSLYPGIQIASYNERRFLVPQEHYDEALNLIQGLRSDALEPKENSLQEDLTIGSKIRIILETILLGWSSLSGKKTTNKPKNDGVRKADTDSQKNSNSF